MAAVTGIRLVSYELQDVQWEDWQGAAQYVAAHAEPSAMVLTYDPDRTLPFNYYFAPISRDIPVHGVPMDVDLRLFNPYEYFLSDTAAVAARIQTLGVSSRPLWFVFGTRLLDSLRTGPSEVTDYLERARSPRHTGHPSRGGNRARGAAVIWRNSGQRRYQVHPSQSVHARRRAP